MHHMKANYLTVADQNSQESVAVELKMKEGSENSANTKSWCNHCRKVSEILIWTTPLHYSSSSSSSSGVFWKGGNSLLKVAVALAMVLLVFSIYQSCIPQESSLSAWLSVSFVNRPSFLSFHELPGLVETFAPVPLDHQDFSALIPGDVSPSSNREDIETFEGQTGDEESVKHANFVTYNGSLSGLQLASGPANDTFSVAEKNLPIDPFQPSLHDSNISDAGFSRPEKDLPADLVDDVGPSLTTNDLSSCPSVEKHTFQDSDTVVNPENTSFVVHANSSHSFSSSLEKDHSNAFSVDKTSSMETTKNDQRNEAAMSEEGCKENQHMEVLVTCNSSHQRKPEADGVTSSKEVLLQHPASDHLTTAAPSVPLVELELSRNKQSFVDTQMPIPSETVEKSMDNRRVRLEQQLYAAKQAIEGATLEESDPSLHRVVYNNISAFSKSYKLMEEVFKIFVYKDGKPPLVHVGPLLGIYASEGKFLDQINRGSAFIVEDPELAHMFYLPYSVTQMTLVMYVEGSRSMRPLNTFIKDYVNQVAASYPFWNRTHGADHFFVSCHDWGSYTARDHEELRKNAIKVVCNADASEDYVLGKDASLPEIYLHDYNPVTVGGPGPVRRTILAFFAGQMHGHVRPVLLKHWKDKDPDMKIYETLPKTVERIRNYVDHMKNSKYCICAAGFEVNSPRIVESIYYDCVPVIIADNFVLPFSDVLNWSTFSVTIPEREIPNLKSALLSIPDSQYKAMQKRLSKVRQHFIWNNEPVKYDVFHMIIHSVWMSRLNRLNQ